VMDQDGLNRVKVFLLPKTPLGLIFAPLQSSTVMGALERVLPCPPCPFLAIKITLFIITVFTTLQRHTYQRFY